MKTSVCWGKLNPKLRWKSCSVKGLPYAGNFPTPDFPLFGFWTRFFYSSTEKALSGKIPKKMFQYFCHAPNPLPFGNFAQIENYFNGIQQYKTFKSDPNLLARPAPSPTFGLCPNIELQKHLGKGWLPPPFRAMPVFKQFF